MKLNQRIYDYADEENLIERQELDDYVVEIYRLNPYEDICSEFTAKGKFAVWSSYDGHNYRLFIEDGYYEKLKDLYKKPINNIWLKFWDKCEKVTSTFRNIVMPLALVVIAVAFIANMFIPNRYVSLGLVIGIAVLYFAFVLIYKKFLNKKLSLYNHESVEEIKKNMGAKRFERLLDDQRHYVDEYFSYDDNENTEDEEINEEEPKAIEENTAEDSTENNEEISADNDVLNNKNE